MRITIWGINYAPEQTGIAPYNTDLCAYLREVGHEVRMVTGFPYYPEWKKRVSDRFRLFRRERIEGVDVFRCWQYVPHRPNAWRRMLHEASFVATSFCRLLFTPRPDLLLVVSPPLLLGPAAWLAGRFKRCPFHFHVQDMQPDAAISLGLLKPGAFTRCLAAVERFTCRRAQTVSGITRGMLQLFSRKGVPAGRQYLLPNWIVRPRADAPDSPLPAESFRNRLGLAPDDFLVVYSGNVGKKQGLEILLDAAERLNESPGAQSIRIVIAGTGAGKPEIEERTLRQKLPVELLPLQPQAMYQAMLREADMAVVTQRKGAGALFFPSKLVALLSAGCPVVTVADADSELAMAVRDGGFGRNVPPEDPDALVAALLDLSRDRAALTAMAAAGRSWVTRFSRQSVLSDFARYLESRPPPQTGAAASLAHEENSP